MSRYDAVILGGEHGPRLARARAKRAPLAQHESPDGPGYWAWLIPLGSGSTSIGIVADAAMHPIPA